jgi:hypothetical protein
MAQLLSQPMQCSTAYTDRSERAVEHFLLVGRLVPLAFLEPHLDAQPHMSQPGF